MTEAIIPQSWVGKRISLSKMYDKDPIPEGTTGTILSIVEFENRYQIGVDWDINRHLSLVCPPDMFEVLD